MAKPNGNKTAPETATETAPAAWKPPSKEAVNEMMVKLTAAEKEVKKAEEAVEKARGKLSAVVVEFLETHGRKAEGDKDYSFPAFVSSALGCKVQPVIRNSATGQRTGFLKRFGEESDLPTY